MASSNSSASEAGVAVTKTTSSNAGDSCMWYADSNCTQPRTGYDCLNVLLSTDECAIDPNGACVSMSVYEAYLENKDYYEPVQRFFPSSNYTYCSANDSVCSTCISEWTANYQSTGSAGSTTYCTGSDGCVCVADCELPDWQQTVIDDECSSSSYVTSSDTFSSGTRICIMVAMGICTAMIFAVFGIRRCVRHAAPRAYGPGSIPRPPPSGPQLSLTGWKSLREKLIETEHSFVKGDSARLDATAHASSHALADAPVDTPAVIVQVGPPPRPALTPQDAGYYMAAQM